MSAATACEGGGWRRARPFHPLARVFCFQAVCLWWLGLEERGGIPPLSVVRFCGGWCPSSAYFMFGDAVLGSCSISQAPNREGRMTGEVLCMFGAGASARGFCALRSGSLIGLV